MSAATAQTQGFQTEGTVRTFAIAIALLVLGGLVWANSNTQMVAYFLVLGAAVLPSILWVRMDSPGIPVLPAVCLAYVPYFAWPILRVSETVLNYTGYEIFRAALTAVLFIVLATAAWQLVLRRWQPREGEAGEGPQPKRVVWFAMAGVILGMVYIFAALVDALEWLGPAFGVVRAIALTIATVSCFLIGVAKAQGILPAKAWIAALVCVGVMVLISWSSLLLVTGIVYSLSLVFGYALVARRIPWLVVIPIVVAVTVLQAGKADIRDRYWASGMPSGMAKVYEMPEMMAQWMSDGVDAISGENPYATPLDRTGLLHMVLLAQSETPNFVDYLGGETYAMLPAILVPRFIESERPASQVGMDLLNIRYGLLTAEGASYTAIGWGLVAEAYANFGYLGVIGIALLLGALCGVLQNWSRGAEIISLPMLTNIAFMMVLINIELDFIQVCSILLQSFAGLLAFLAVFKVFAMR